MEGAAAVAAMGSGSLSPIPPSPPQHMGSTDTELEDRCPICLGSWTDPSFVMPCLHCFCYGCILWWADNKTQCPLCKRKMTSVLHSVRADDDFEEHVIIPPMTPPVIVRSARRAHREPDAPDLHSHGVHQEWGAARDVHHLVGGFQLPNWMSCFSTNPVIQQTLHSWVYQNLEMLFGAVTPRAQHVHVCEQQCRSEECHLPHQWDTCGATGQEDSSSSLTPDPERSSVDEMTGSSFSASDGGPNTYPSASTTVLVEQQESQEETERLYAGPPNSTMGSDTSPRGPQQPRKRRASRPKGSPARRKPRH